MNFLKTLLISALIGMVASAAILPEGQEKMRIIDFFGKSVFVIFMVMLPLYALRLRNLLKSKAPKAVSQVSVPEGRRVIVDGSNVMHWGGEPSLTVLSRVLSELQNRGYGPLVYFDANVGYKLFNKHLNHKQMAQHLGLPAENVVHAPSRVPADEIILEHAVKEDLRVVTNDRFQDWKFKFPKVAESGFLVKGRWQEGSVILLGLGRA